MAEGYIHVEIATAQISKRRPTDPCGDVVDYMRTSTATTLVVSDGMGHGIKAHIAAQMCTARLLELMRQGYSTRSAFYKVVTTMEKVKGTDLPYAVFTVVRILSDGVATILTYEMPPPVFITPRYAQVLQQRKVAVDNCLIGEANCHLEPGEGILVVSDGITQSGLGMGLTHGWTAEGMNQYINDCLSDGVKVNNIPNCVLNQARENWHDGLGDDCTAVIASCRWGRTVNVLTGPPSDRKKDSEVINRFMRMEGAKVVSGGTTAQLVSKVLNREIHIEVTASSLLAPPRSIIEGIDLVTEGAITLNQVYNVLEEDSSRFDEESAVTELHELLTSADRVNFLMGTAVNPATEHVSFRQKGILSRQTIVPLIAEKLRKMGKLVVVERT